MFAYNCNKPQVYITPERRGQIATLTCRMLLELKGVSLPIFPMGILNLCRDVIGVRAAEDEGFLMPDGVDAMTFTYPNGRKSVIFRTDRGQPRATFSLAHELGHIALKHEETDLQPWHDLQEHEANLFAGFLLCPQDVIDMMWEKALTQYIPVTAIDVSRKTGVSPSCADIVLRRRRADIPTEISQKMRSLFKEFV